MLSPWISPPAMLDENAAAGIQGDFVRKGNDIDIN
jgi:hypothetical protein